MSKTDAVDPLGMVARIHQHLQDQNMYVKPACAMQCMAQLLGFLGFEDVVIYQSTGQRLEQVAAHGPKRCEQLGVVAPITLAWGEGVVGHAAAWQTMTLLHEATYDKRYVIDDDRRQSELAQPFFAAGQLVGVVDSEHQQAYHFNQSHIDLMRGVIAVLGFDSQPPAANQAVIQATQVIRDNIRNMPATKPTSKSHQPASAATAIDWPAWVVAGLKHFTDNRQLNQQLNRLFMAHPMLRFRLPTVESLRQLLSSTTQTYATVDKTKKYQQILQHTYLHPLSNGQLVAERVHMAYSTYRRHLKKAQDMLAFDVQQQLQPTTTQTPKPSRWPADAATTPASEQIMNKY